MKNRTLIFMLVATVSFVVSCGSDGTVVSKLHSPSAVAVRFFNSISACDVENVKVNICFEDPAEQEIFDEYLERIFVPAAGKQNLVNDSAYTVVSETVSGDTAYVELSAMTAVEKKVRMKVRLLNSDDGWKVDGSQAVLHRAE
ncbi:MAG: hypothetical protein IJF06_07210 [Bacteroidaceae bacterium]|nr:hypothetical protein [Bacteroidaceae bacterium]